MRMRNICCLLMAAALFAGCLVMDAGAAETELYSLVMERASGRFSMDIGRQSTTTADSSFPLEIGETVTINASYSPRSASVDFGLIAPDGYFYFLSGEKGSFNETIKVDQRGNYTLAIRNNSNFAISVSGFVNY